MVNLDEFLKTYDGKYVESGGSSSALNQCTDLANQYIIDVLDREPILWTNADDFPAKATEFCDFYPNTPESIPERGDLIIWGLGSYGHISIFLEGDARTFRSFDQNYPSGTPAHIQEHNYSGVIGYLRPIKEQTMNSELLRGPLTNHVIWFYKTFKGVTPPEADVKAHVDTILATLISENPNNSISDWNGNFYYDKKVQAIITANWLKKCPPSTTTTTVKEVEMSRWQHLIKFIFG